MNAFCANSEPNRSFAPRHPLLNAPNQFRVSRGHVSRGETNRRRRWERSPVRQYCCSDFGQPIPWFIEFVFRSLRTRKNTTAAKKHIISPKKHKETRGGGGMHFATVASRFSFVHSRAPSAYSAYSVV